MKATKRPASPLPAGSRGWQQLKPMKSKKNSNLKRAGVAVDALVRPVGLATIYISEKNAPYRMEIRQCKGGGRLWAYFYKGKNRVWDCNDGFAKEHFVPVPNTKLDNILNTPKVERIEKMVILLSQPMVHI